MLDSLPRDICAHRGEWERLERSTDVSETVDVIWEVSDTSFAGAERCRLDSVPDGWRLSGVVVAAYDGRPLDVHYRVMADAGWVTRLVEVTMDHLATPRQLQFDVASSGRCVDREPAPKLDGCVDVDLGVTPATNIPQGRGSGWRLPDWARWPHSRQASRPRKVSTNTCCSFTKSSTLSTQPGASEQRHRRRRRG